MARLCVYSIIVLFVISCQTASDNSGKEPEVIQREWTNKERQFILDELDRTTKSLLKEVDRLGRDQWTFREERNRWNIAEIVEHLTLQNELHYRELYATSNAPAMPRYLPVTTDQDTYFQDYATDPQKSQSKWFLQPLGRFDSRRQSVAAFQRARDGIRGFVEKTEVDLRIHFTFRNNGGMKSIEAIKIGEVRDLHQLLLTGIAHTDRHIRQIKNIKKHPSFPRDI